MIAQPAVMQNFCFELKSSDAMNSIFAVQQLEICTGKPPVGIPHPHALNLLLLHAPMRNCPFIRRCHRLKDLTLTKEVGVTRSSTYLASFSSLNFRHHVSYYQERVAHTMPFLDTLTGFCIGWSSCFAYWAACFYPSVTSSC